MDQLAMSSQFHDTAAQFCLELFLCYLSAREVQPSK